MFITDPPTEAEWSSLEKSDHSSRQRGFLAVNGFFLCLAILAISLRIFTKVIMAAKLYVDDYLMTASAILYTAVCIINIRAVHLGFGKHAWDLDGVNVDSTLYEVSNAAAPVQSMNYAALIIIAPAIILAKLSVLSILLRVFPESMRILRGFLIAMAFVLTACCVSQAMLVAFQCGPIQSSWDIDAGGTCYIEPLEVVTMALGVVNVVTDVVICVTPIPYFWRLNIPKPQKLGLCAVFMAGLIACIISIVRVISLRGLDNNPDVTYVAIPYFGWSTIETALIIITGSMPFLQPLLATILPNFFRSRNFPSLFASDLSGNKNPSAEVSNNSSSPSSSTGTLASAHCDVTVTKEFRLEEDDGMIQGNFDSRPPCTPRTLLPPHWGYRTMVTCEKGQA